MRQLEVRLRRVGSWWARGTPWGCSLAFFFLIFVYVVLRIIGLVRLRTGRVRVHYEIDHYTSARTSRREGAYPHATPILMSRRAPVPPTHRFSSLILTLASREGTARAMRKTPLLTLVSRHRHPRRNRARSAKNAGTNGDANPDPPVL